MNSITLVCGLLLFGASAVLAQTPATEATSPTPVSVASPSTAATAQAASPSLSSDEQQLLAIEQEWCNAYLHGDAEYLTRLLTEDFVATNGRAGMNNKAAELQNMRDRAVHYTVFENHDMTVHLYNDAAVVTGRTRSKGTVAASGKLVEAETRFTDTFVRAEGRWRVAAAHTSHVDD